MSTKLLVLGIDAASPELLMRWATEGKLPALRVLIDRGTSGAVRGLEGLYIGSTWPSLYTGLNPASHGFYRIDQLRSGSYGFFSPLACADGVGGVPFWKVASDASRRVAVLDVPLSRIDRSLNGVQVVEWGGHDAVFGFHASTKETEHRIRAKVGAYPLPSNCDAVRVGADDYTRFVAALEAAIDKKAELTVDFLAQEEWDLFVQVFTESHCVGHQCWHLHDSTHPAHDPELVRAVGDPLERIYTAVDRAVAKVVAQAGDEARILVICAHGMGPYRGAQFLLAEILFRLGASARLRAVAMQPPNLADRWIGAARAGWSMLPVSVRRVLRPVRTAFGPRSGAADAIQQLGVDPSASKCFAVPNGSPVGGIRLNLVGREPQGVLRPGREADVFCAELASDLRAIVDERTGGPLIAAVHKTESLYSGARRDALPDLLVQWTTDPPTGTTALAGGRGAHVRATSPKIGTVDGDNRYARTGEHLPAGMFICAGSGIPATRRREPVSIMDFHPTICALLGLAEANVDGVVIPELAPERANVRL